MAITRLDPARLLGEGSVVQVVYEVDRDSASTGTMAFSDPPQDDESLLLVSATITPKSASNILIIQTEAYLKWNINHSLSMTALFIAPGSSAVDVSAQGGNINIWDCHTLSHKVVAGTTSPITFNLRGGGSTNAGTLTTNDYVTSTAGNRITIWEIAA